jgi:bacillithiol system protein YtxJ
MNTFVPLTQKEQLAEIDDLSNKPHLVGVLIFKHSTRCSVSHFAYKSFLQEWHYENEEFPVYFLDLLKHRELSNEIAKKYQVIHQSPQILFIKNGACVGNASHNSVSVKQVEDWLDA